MHERPVRDGAGGFIADLADNNTVAVIDGATVMYKVIAVAGVLAGQLVSTAVNVNELGAWPAVPPHWLHFPDAVRFVTTNADRANTQPGWQRHSRNIDQWDMMGHPGQVWLAHVRAVVATAV